MLSVVLIAEEKPPTMASWSSYLIRCQISINGSIVSSSGINGWNHGSVSVGKRLRDHPVQWNHLMAPCPRRFQNPLQQRWADPTEQREGLNMKHGELHILLCSSSLYCKWLCASASFFLTQSYEHTHAPKTRTWPHSSGYREKTESSIVGPIHLILFPKSLYWADQARFSRLVVGCLLLHRCIRRKTCVVDVSATRVKERRLQNINHTKEQPAAVKCP